MLHEFPRFQNRPQDEHGHIHFEQEGVHVCQLTGDQFVDFFWNNYTGICEGPLCSTTVSNDGSSLLGNAQAMTAVKEVSVMFTSALESEANGTILDSTTISLTHHHQRRRHHQHRVINVTTAAVATTTRSLLT